MALNQAGGDWEFLFDAYVHRWDAQASGWKGTGWSQPVRILVRNAVGSLVVPVLPAAVSDGRLRLGDVERRNLVQFPLEFSGDIDLWLETVTADAVNVVGRGVRIEAMGDGRYLEDLPAELRPDAD
jgi:hypothetical protein